MVDAQLDKFTRETITWIASLTDKLFRFRTTRPAAFRFAAGQWGRLGVVKPNVENLPSTPVWRAYSIASASYDEHLEFYSIVVPNGEFTSTLATLKVGDTVLLEKQAFGFLTTARFQASPQGSDLWLLSTGTGLAPFISVLHELEVWQTYARIIVVHGVRESAELAYINEIAALKTHEAFAEFMACNPSKLIYQACVSREDCAGALRGRITTLIDNGALEAAVGVPLDLERSRVMICGNPEMVDETRALLKARGMTVSRNAKPGQIAVENYW
jgi:ferredoxin/flavodoxin---NADP+ reductase